MLSWKCARGSAASSPSGALIPAWRLKGCADGCLECGVCLVGLDWTDDGAELKSLLDAFIDHEACEEVTGFVASFFDFRLNGLLALKGLLEKKPDRRLVILFSGDDPMPGIWTPPAGCFTGDVFPDIGSALVNEDGFE